MTVLYCTIFDTNLFPPSFAFSFLHPISVSVTCPQQVRGNQIDSVSFREIINLLNLIKLELSRARHGTVRQGMVWYGMVWYGTVRYGMVWYHIVFHFGYSKSLKIM